MLIPMRGPDGLLIPTTAAGLREQARIPSPGGEFPVDDTPNSRTPMPGGMPPSMGGMTDIPYQPPKRPDALPGQGVAPFANMTDIERTPAATSTPREGLLHPTQPGGPAKLMKPQMPIDVPATPAPAAGATPVTPASDDEPTEPDIRQYLKMAGVTMLKSTSPAERAQGMQMLFEASQPTPGEVARAERKRMGDVVTRAQVDPDLQHAAGIAAELGGDASLIMKTLGLDAESRQRRDAMKNRGTEELDKAYAPKFVEFKLQDQSGMAKSLSQLADVQQLLKTPNVPWAVPITGPVMGLVPDSLKAFTEGGRRAITARELTEEVIQQSLRQILGAQFTQKEGENLMARTFNDKVSPEENMLRGQSLMKQIQEAYTDKTAAADYFQENGTLAGFKGRAAPTLADIEQRAKEDMKHPARSGTAAQVTPRQAQPDMKRPDMSDEALLQRAQDAIAKGADPAVIGQRLKSWGITPQ